jgi:RHS repeat-associated protein
MLGYQSAWADPASGKDLTGARWYAPGAGDFTSADTVHVSPDPDPAAGNPFAYAADNPLTGTDPTGHQVDSPLGRSAAATPALVKANASAATAAAAAAHAAHLAHLAHLAVVAKAAAVAAKAAAKIPPYCAGNNIGALGTCMSAVYRAAGGQTDASGVPTTKGSSYNPKVASQAMGVVQKQYNAVQDATQKRDAAQQQADARQQAAAQPAAAVARSPVTAPGCTQVQLHYGACPSEAGAAGTTAAQVKGSFIGAGLVIVQSVPGLGEIADAFGLGGDGASLIADAGETATADGTADAGAGTIEEEAGCPALGGSSFTAGTLVLLAIGKTAPISSLTPGDKVLAADTRTGKDQPETVTAVLVHHDTNLYDLTIKTKTSTEVIHTTASHLFWAPYPHYGWIPAKHLKPGMHLKTPDGQTAVVVGGSVPAAHDGWMWDLTVPGNNDHDFYVTAGATAVLVHNINNDACGVQGELFDATPYRASSGSGNDTFLYQKLSSTGEHLKYGITDNPATRYTSAELNGGQLNILASGTREDMLALERSLHETLPIGPEEGQTFYIGIQVARGLRPPPY